MKLPQNEVSVLSLHSLILMLFYHDIALFITIECKDCVHARLNKYEYVCTYVYVYQYIYFSYIKENIA